MKLSKQQIKLHEKAMELVNVSVEIALFDFTNEESEIQKEINSTIETQTNFSELFEQKTIFGEQLTLF